MQLRDRDRAVLKSILSGFPEVRQAWLFGSRAVGRARRASDIDLAIEAPDISPARWQRLREALEEAPIIFPIDLVRLDTLDDAELGRAIRQQRVPV